MRVSLQFQMLSKDFIFAWVGSLVVKGTRGKAREGPTLTSVARYMGLPLVTLKTMAYWPEKVGYISLERQRLFSRVIAEIENGQVEFVRQGRGATIIRKAERPRPIARYQVVLSKDGVRLQAKPRPAPFVPMPAFKNVTLR